MFGGWEILAILFALWFAIKAAGTAVWRNTGIRKEEKKLRKAARSQLVSQYMAAAEKEGDGGVTRREAKAAKAAARLAAASAVTVTSWGMIWWSFKDAWRDGWRRGKRDMYAKRDGQIPEPPAAEGPGPEKEPVEPTEPVRSYCTALKERPELAKYCGRLTDPGEQFCDTCKQRFAREAAAQEPEPEPDYVLPDPINPPTERTTPVATESRTHGEVHTLAGLLTELDAMKAEATADLEDAQGDEKRAAECVEVIDNIKASLANLNVDRGTIDAVGAMHECFVGDRDRAKDRATAADHKLSVATAARETAQRNHAGIREAVVAAPVRAADGAFYQE